MNKQNFVDDRSVLLEVIIPSIKKVKSNNKSFFTYKNMKINRFE